MNIRANSSLEDEEFPNVYEKWLKSRLNYAVMQETREPANPGFIDAVVTNGDCKHLAENVLREELWVRNRYPNSNFFGDRVIAYRFPRQVDEILDFRFSRDPLNKPKHELKPNPLGPVYNVSLRELATVACWGAPYFDIPTHLLPKQMISPYTQEELHKASPEQKSSSFGLQKISTPAKRTVSTPAECQHLLPGNKTKQRAKPIKRRR
ncbi:hypothetical protein ElyMa_005923100 [Elysia marginata]|uniref:Uncharacterized protein n=1 Tax=Elysia marginata TaxID=1093978 RepID=A0AAV4G841_9GAST|nr:hypothetical protein ElyMa_005923100 [Elysia marginata]